MKTFKHKQPEELAMERKAQIAVGFDPNYGGTGLTFEYYQPRPSRNTGTSVTYFGYASGGTGGTNTNWF